MKKVIVLVALTVIISFSFSTAVGTADATYDVENPPTNTFEYAPDIQTEFSPLMLEKDTFVPVQASIEF